MDTAAFRAGKEIGGGVVIKCRHGEFDIEDISECEWECLGNCISDGGECSGYSPTPMPACFVSSPCPKSTGDISSCDEGCAINGCADYVDGKEDYEPPLPKDSD